MKRRSSVPPQLLFLTLILVGYLAWLIWQSWPDSQFRFWVLDVGQGNAELIVTPDNHQILYDGGPDDTILLELGRRMPFWDRTIEYVIISHFHADHITGLIEVLRRYQVGEIWISGATYTTDQYHELMELIRDQAIPMRIVAAGDSLAIDGLDLTILYPLVPVADTNPSDPHDATLVVKVTALGHTFLLTGDLDERHEEELIKYWCELPGPVACPALASDFLMVPHHGSQFGLDTQFLEAVQPTSAAIPVGRRNRFGHPHSLILERLIAAGVEFWRTDQDGSIDVTLSETGLIVTPIGL